jgi:hypothetical protein
MPPGSMDMHVDLRFRSWSILVSIVFLFFLILRIDCSMVQGFLL